MRTGFSWGNLREGGHLKDPGVDGTIILKWIFETWDGRIDWIYCILLRILTDKRALVIARINLWVL